MSIVDPPRSFTRNGYTVRVEVDEAKAAAPKWNEAEHPRDREGRFIETGAEVRVWGGALAKVVRNVGGGLIEIEYAGGSHAKIHRNYLTVVKRPDGTAPTSKRNDHVAAAPPQAPVVPDAPEIAKAPQLDVNTADIGDGLEHFLRQKDPELADRARQVAADYQAAVGNDIPDDEADERARLITVLDEVDSKHSDDRRIQAMSTALRAEATHEPDGKPQEIPAAAAPAAPQAPDSPAAVEKPKTENVTARDINKGDVLHTRLGRATVVEQPVRQPNQSYALILDRGIGKRPDKLVMGSRDRVDREIAPAAPAPVAADDGGAGPVTVRPAGTPDPGFPIPQPPDAPPATPKPAPTAPDTSKPRTYRTTPIGAREAQYAGEVMDTDGYQTGFTVQGQTVTVTDPDSALFTLAGIRDVHADNANEPDFTSPAERRTARAGRDALTNLMNSIRQDYGLTGDGKPSPQIDGTPDNGGTPNLPQKPDAPETGAASGDVEAAKDDIRTAYQELRPDGTWLGLVDLRGRLTQYDRATQDQALRELSREPGVHVQGEANQQALTQEDRDAAVTFGGSSRHILAIDGVAPAAGARRAAPQEPDQVDSGSAPDADKPSASLPPVKPARTQLDGFSAAESARIHNAVEDHAAQYYRGPGTPTPDNATDYVGGIDSAARYVAEGHLKDLLDTHGLAKVKLAVLGAIREDESVLTRSQEDRNKNKADRDAKLAEINKTAGAAAQAGEWDDALHGLDEIETIDPTYRPGGLSIDDLRGRLTAMRGTEQPQEDVTPDDTVDAPEATVPDVADTAPDVSTPEATDAPEAPAEPVQAALEDIHVGDVLAYGGRNYTVTRSESDSADPSGRGWMFEAEDENGSPLHRRGPRTGTWPRVSTAEPEQRSDAAPDNAPEAPAAPAAPAAAPAAQPLVTQRRFATLDAVRQWLRGEGSIPLKRRGDPDGGEALRRTNARIADDPELAVSDRGLLMVHRNPTQDGKKEWRIASPANGLYVPGTANTRAEALQLANLYEAHLDADGNPPPFDQDDAGVRLPKWRDANGVKLIDRIRQDRDAVPTTRRRPADWRDPWWRGETREPARTEAPSADAPSQIAGDTPAVPVPATVPDFVRQNFRVLNIGTDISGATYQDDTGTDAPDGVTLWRAEMPEEGPVWLAFDGDVYLGKGGSRAKAIDEANFTRSQERRGQPAAPTPEADVPAPDIDEPGDEEVPAVPAATDAPSTAPTVAGDARWKIEAPATTGDSEADKRALATSLRAAARAAATPEDRAALNWAARQLVPPVPRPRPEGGAPRKPRTRSPQRQARAQADSDVAAARAARKPPVSPEARMQALADLADELDRLGVGGVTVPPPSGGGASGDGGGEQQSGTSIVAALRGYVAEYKKRRAEMASGGAGSDSGATGGGANGSDSGTGGGALQEVPAEDVPGAGRPGGVLPEPGDGGGPADRRPDGSDRGTGPAERGVPGEGGAVQDGAPVGGGTGDAGDGAARPGDSGVGAGPAGDGLPAVDGSVGAGRTADTGGPGVGRRDEPVAGGDAGTGGGADRPAAPAEREPVRVADAGLAADGVTEADQPAPTPAAVPTNVASGEDFRPRGVDDFAPAGKVGKLNANIAALQTLRQLQDEKRPATPEEQAILAKWAGWGGLPEVFDPLRADYAPQREVLKGLLSESEWNEAKRNTLNAHYTDARVVSAVWDAVEALGFDGGRVLEPGSGSGTFIGFAPENADMVGVELDSTTAALSQFLYPNARIRNESFARTNLPDGSFDATVGNVPFGNFSLSDRRHNKDNESIHNHFILKSLDLTRPGGLVAVLTSRYTLDSQNDRARQKMADKADLVGAVRLPTGSHQRASGTDVIEDLLIFRVRARGETPQTDQSWVTSTKKDVNGFEIGVNNYWDEHPENVLGTLDADKGQYGTGDLIVRGDRNMADLPEVLNGIVEQAREDGLVATVSNGPRADLVDADESRHDGHIRVEEDGTFTQATRGASVPFEVSAAQRAELGSLIGLRDTLSRLLDAESSSRGLTPEITNLRAQLNTEYDAYVAKNGPINRFKLSKTGTRIRPQQGGFRRDPMSAIVRALETFDPSDGSAQKASIFTKRAVAPRELRTSTDDPADAVSLSIDTYGEVNLPAIANMLGVDEAEARERLTGHVFEEPPTLGGTSEVDARIEADAGIDPTGDILATSGIEAPSFVVPPIDEDAIGTPGKLEPTAAYLSGNVRRKLAIAQAAAALDPRFQSNVDALKAVIPTNLGADEIDARLGAAWIDKDTVQQFLRELIQDRYETVKVSHSGGSIWSVDGPNYGNLSTEVWGTEKRSASQLVQSLLEQRSIKITKKMGTDRDAPSVPDLEATLAAQEKATAIQERFSEWLWEDADRARKMASRYNDLFNALVLRQYDGSARAFPGMADSWDPREHQRNAVERIVNEPTAMLAHVVGAGKTAEMVLGTAELKRLGMARKPAIVVPNHMLEQFTREYLEIYPQAKILAAGSEDLRGDGRREFVGRAATGDWDVVILTQGAFESVPMSQEQQQAYIDREMATMRAQLAQAQADEMSVRAGFDAGTRKNIEKTVKKMETALLRAEEALKKKMDKQKDVGVSFEQTGIDYLMVDEAHGYSNLRTLSNIQGAGTTGSDKATDLHMKLEYLRETSQSGRVATFATGTPIRNTVTQAYVMQKFLRPDLLEEAGITSFDQWASTFGETVDSMELKPEGTGFRQTTRFAKFRNVPEFLKMFHTFSDVKMADDLKLPTPDLVGGKATTVTVPSTDALAEYIAELGERADLVRNGGVEPEDDNMLKISGDGRKAALSMKLVGGEHEPGKIEAAADRIASIWQENQGNVYTDPKTGEVDPISGALQIVFLDMGTPGSEDKWNGYDALKKELTARGMDPSTIRYVHEAKNDAQKAEMFAAARAGRISVLIGSSEKMGVGTNMQRRAVALHHLDAPWRPSDVEQRDGRIMRQGNLNKDVQILRYVTEGSFDAYMWQTLERKAKFINQIMKGSLDVREIDDIGDTAMSYGEIKALATGNPDLLEKAKTDTELTKLDRLERTFNRTQTNLKSDIQTQTRSAQVWESYAAQYDAAIPKRTDTRGEKFTMKVGYSDFNKRQDAADALRLRMRGVFDQDRWGEAPERDLGTVGGFTVTGQVTPTPGGGRDLIVRFAGVPGEVTRIPTNELYLEGFGVITRLESALEAFEAKRDRLLNSAAEARIEVGRMEERVGAGFPRAAELAALRVRSQRINMKIERDARRSTGEVIPFDPLIDSSDFDAPLPGEADASVDVAPEDFGATTGADLRRAAEARADAQKALVIIGGRAVVRLVQRKVAA